MWRCGESAGGAAAQHAHGNLLTFRYYCRYEKQYLHVKAPRKLVWKPSLGCVTLDVTFEVRAPCNSVTYSTD